MKWIIEKGVFPEEEEYLIETLKDNDISYGYYKPDGDYTPDRHILRCSCKSLQTQSTFISLFIYHVISCILFNNNMLNNFCYVGNAEDILNKEEKIFSTFGVNDKIWVKPDNPYKLFNAEIIHKKWIYKIFNMISKDINMNNFPCIVAKPQEIISEYRFFFKKTRILSCSSYKIFGEVEFTNPINRYVYNFAEEMAFLYYNELNMGCKSLHTIADNLWTMDVCELSNGDIKIVELNSFYSAGFYNCEINDIVKGILE